MHSSSFVSSSSSSVPPPPPPLSPINPPSDSCTISNNGPLCTFLSAFDSTICTHSNSSRKQRTRKQKLFQLQPKQTNTNKTTCELITNNLLRAELSSVWKKANECVVSKVLGMGYSGIVVEIQHLLSNKQFCLKVVPITIHVNKPARITSATASASASAASATVKVPLSKDRALTASSLVAIQHEVAIQRDIYHACAEYRK